MEYNFLVCEQNVGAGKKHFDFCLWRIMSVHFLSKDGKNASYEGRDGWKFFFKARVSIPTFMLSFFNSTVPYLYHDLACKQLCFPPREVINGRNENTRDNNIIVVNLDVLLITWSRTIKPCNVDLRLLLFKTFRKTLIDFPAAKT